MALELGWLCSLYGSVVCMVLYGSVVCMVLYGSVTCMILYGSVVKVERLMDERIMEKTDTRMALLKPAPIDKYLQALEPANTSPHSPSKVSVHVRTHYGCRRKLHKCILTLILLETYLGLSTNSFISC